MKVFPAGLPLPAIRVDLDLGLDRTGMTGGVVRSRRLFATLPMTCEVTWRLTRAERVQLVEFMDEVGVDLFRVPLRVPGDPRPFRSVVAEFASGLDLEWTTESHDDVTATLIVRKVEVVLAWGALLSPDGSPIVAPSGVPVHYEELG